MLDAFEAEHPERRVVRIRPGVVLQAQAASALARYFLGPFVPQSLVRPSLLPVVPSVDKLAFQVVHAEDMARAYVLACVQPGDRRFNIATEPVLDPPHAALLRRRQVRCPPRAARGWSTSPGGCTSSRSTRAGSTSAG
jgi:nucleoside-diphosphate-sugar epimerase